MAPQLTIPGPEQIGETLLSVRDHVIDWARHEPPEEPVPTIITPGTAYISGAKVEYKIEQPEDPDRVVDGDVAVLIEHGYFGIESSYAGPRNAMAQQGRKVVTYGRAHQSLGRFLHPSQIGKPHRLISQAPLAVIRALDTEHSIEAVDAQGHSYGGANALELALHKPDHHRTVTLVASAGTDGHSIGSLTKKSPDELRHDIIPSALQLARACGFTGLREAIEYAANPIRLVCETFDVANRDIRPHIETVINDLHIPVAAIAFMDDKLFDPDEVEAHIGHLVSEFRFFPYPEAGHAAMITMPYEFADFYTATVNKMLAKQKHFALAA